MSQSDTNVNLDVENLPNIEWRIAKSHRNCEESNNCYVVDIVSVIESTGDAKERKNGTR